jgi:hypothetical protein
MSSTGVCYVDQLGGFGSGPYKVLHDRYRNSMYKSFTHADLKDYILREEDNPYLDTYQELLLPHVERESDVTITPKGSLVAIENARYRLADQHVEYVLNRDARAARQLPPPHGVLRDKILERSLSLEEFQQQIAAQKPELGKLLDRVQKLGALRYLLHPVGFVIARHEIGVRVPALAVAIDEALDNDGSSEPGGQS